MKKLLPVLCTLLVLLVLLTPGIGHAQSADDLLIVQARDALRTRDRAKLASLRNAVAAAHHPLLQWVEYWELSNRLADAQVGEVEDFYTRWRGSYVEDRLRNDWLLELGHRRDWAAFKRDKPRFRMDDDREVTCYALLTQHQDGQDVLDAARSAWLGQRDAGEGCNLLASTLYAAGLFKDADVWADLQLAAERGRVRVARASAALLGPTITKAVAELFADPRRFLQQRRRPSRELALLALIRLAVAEPADAAKALEHGWQRRLNKTQQTLAWAVVARQSAFELQPEALGYYRQAWRLVKRGTPPDWGDDMFAWQVRAALRAPAAERDRWALVDSGINAMSSEEQRDITWVYWKAQSLQAQAAAGAKGGADRTASRVLLESIAGERSFYGLLANDALGRSVLLPAPPPAPSAAEQALASSTPGFMHALQLFSLGLRSEAVREWNFTLRGLDERALLAAAALACEHEIWDRCINTSERTRSEVNIAQRFPTPFRPQVLAKAHEIGLDAAFIYGLIRQESRFVMDARSGVGASGLMQVMPGTAKWTAKKIGMPFEPGMINERDTNLHLGANYLKLVLDAFDGSQPLAAAAYNAGPNRVRRWRAGPPVAPEIWVENIPFGETRDYVKKVLSNAVDYAAVLQVQTQPQPQAQSQTQAQPQPVSLRARLGASIGPPDAGESNREREIP